MKFGEDCEGYQTPWTPCNEDCFRAKTFYLTAAQGCEKFPHAYKNDSVSFKLCTEDPCPIKLSDAPHQWFGAELKSHLFEAGLNSNIIIEFSTLLEYIQVFTCTLFILILMALRHVCGYAGGSCSC